MQVKERLALLLAEHKITMRAVFIPFSRSRNKGEKLPSLNWTITLAKDGRDFLIADYMQGSGHCPSYTQGRQTVDDATRVRWECENGKRCKELHGMGFGGKPLDPPDVAVVLSCLLSDASAIDYPTFQQWADAMGGNPDIIREEKIYRDCLEIALKLRATLGDTLMQEMQKLSQEM